MDLYEAEGKRLFRDFGIPTDAGILILREEDAAQAAPPCVLKVQVLSGKRGKAGGIVKVNTREELDSAVKRLLGMTIGGSPAAGVLAVPVLDIAHEHYLSITLDSVKRQRVLLYSADGGMDIEQIAREAPERLLRLDVTDGVCRKELAASIAGMGVSEKTAAAIAEIAEKLYELYRKCDATTAEINPLAELSDGSLTAADSKVAIDGSALYRHGGFTLIPREKDEDPLVNAVRDAGISYVEVDSGGTIGLVVSGAGLGMTTLDTVRYFGLDPYDFTDLGSRMNAECVRLSVRLLLQNKALRGIIINGFGGMYTTPEMVSWILEGLEELGDRDIPVVVKVRGNDQEAGWKILEEHGVPYVGFGTTDDLVKLMVSELEERR